MKLLTLIFILISFSASFSQANNPDPLQNTGILNEKNDELYLQFYFTECEYQPGKYLGKDILEAGFIKYDGKLLPRTIKNKRRMYVFTAYFSLNENLKDKFLSLYMGPVDYPLHVYLNGKMLHKRGTFTDGYTSSMHTADPVFLPNDALRYVNGNNKPNELVIELYPKYPEEHRFLAPAYISGYNKVAREAFIRNFFRVYLVRGTIYVTFVLFFYFIFLYFTRKEKRDLRYLYFAFTCLFFAFAYINLSFNFNSSDELVNESITRFAFPLSNTFFCLFCMEFTKILNKKSIKYLIFTITAFAAVGAFFTGNIVNLMAYFGIVTIFVIFPVQIFYTAITVISTIRTKDKYSITLLIGIILLNISVIHDMSYFNAKDIPYTWLTVYGYMILLTFVFFILAWEQSDLFKKSIRDGRELTRLNKLKDDFISGTSHELKTPTNSIVGMAETALTKYQEKLPSEINTYLEFIIKNGLRLSNLVNELLDSTRLKNNDINLNLIPIDLKQFTDVIAKMCIPLLKDKKIQLVNEIKSVIFVNADENRLQQIFSNLIDNAIKFTENGLITIDANKKETMAEIIVEDTGIGIPEDKIDYVFEEFEQVDTSLTKQNTGIGLGLSIVKRLVELHNGTIRVESTLNKGTKFIFTLPLFIDSENGFPTSKTEINEVGRNLIINQNHDILREKGIAETISGKADSIVNSINEETPTNNKLPSVLIVDDNESNIFMLKNLLLLNRFSVECAFNGEEALEKVASSTKLYNAILLDVMMPKKNGFDVCFEIRKTYPPDVLPIIFLTVRNEVANLKTGFEYGANDYITKPFSQDELIARLNLHIKLAQAKKDLQNINEHLDKLVATRTEMLQKREIDLQKANKELEQFAYVVSHDLKQPLIIIKGYINHFFKDTDLVPANQKITKIIEILLDNVSYMEELIANILEYSISDKKEYYFEAVDTESVVKKILTDLGIMSSEEIEVSLSNLPVINTDIFGFRQILQNMITNSIKYKKQNEILQLKIGAERNSDNWQFYVSDNGIGIDKKHLKDIFSVFTRGASDKSIRGAGIGLSTCQKIIERFGGSIWAESEINVGTTIYFTLPA